MAEEGKPTQLLTVNEACELTRLSRDKLYGEINAGRLRSIKVGRRRLVPLAAIDAWIQGLLEVTP